MPIYTECRIKALLADGAISAITVDTSIFYEKQFQLNSDTFQSLARLSGRAFVFMLTDTVAKEIIKKIEEEALKSLTSAKRGIGQALRLFETTKPSMERILEQITSGQEPKTMAEKRFWKYIEVSGCEILNDTQIVDLATIFEDYFSARPPFGPDKKKNEFPDALALNCLEQTAIDRNIGILVVSKDFDWRNFCTESKRLFYVSDIERALALIADAPQVLRKTVLDWLNLQIEEEGDVISFVSESVGLMDFNIHVEKTSISLNAPYSFGEFEGVRFPQESDVDIIEYIRQEDDEISVLIVNVPLSISVNIHCYVSFSLGERLDEEFAYTGEREIEKREVINTEATIRLAIREQGAESGRIEFVDLDITDNVHDVELGLLDVFAREQDLNRE